MLGLRSKDALDFYKSDHAVGDLDRFMMHFCGQWLMSDPFPGKALRSAVRLMRTICTSAVLPLAKQI